LARLAVENIEKQHITAFIDIDAAIDVGGIVAYLDRNNRFHFNLYNIANVPVLLHAAEASGSQLAESRPAMRDDLQQSLTLISTLVEKKNMIKRSKGTA